MDGGAMTLRFVDFPRWVRDLPRDGVIPALCRMIELLAPTRYMSNPNPDRTDIRVQFYHHETAEGILDFYNLRYVPGVGDAICFEWSPFNLREEGQQYVRAPLHVTHRFQEPDVHLIIPHRRFVGFPLPLHPTDLYWFCRQNPLQPEISRHYRHLLPDQHYG